MARDLAELLSSACLALATPIYDTLEPEFWRSHRNLQIPGLNCVIMDPHGFLLPHARRLVTRAVLATPTITHVLWIDADMVFPPHAAVQLLAHDLPLVGGLCFQRRPPYVPTLFRDRAPVLDYPEGLVAVDHTGPAFLLMRRDVLEVVATAHGLETLWDDEGGRCGDDVFMNAARACGFPIHVDTTLKIGHIGKLEERTARAR